MKMISRFHILILILIAGLWTACKRNGNVETAGPDEYYTCSMDPQVIENKPGFCPICHMRLIKVKKSGLKPGQIKLSSQQVRLANLTYDTIRRTTMAKVVSLTGKLAVDQDQAEAISTPIGGRIDKLFIRSEGDYIPRGALLYEIYSEELNAVQAEYIASLSNSALQDLVIAARKRLLYLGMTESEVDKLKFTKKAELAVPIYARVDGFVTELTVKQGDYVSSGTTLFRLASLSSLWIETQVYIPYLPYLSEGTEAEITVPAVSDKRYHGKVIFIDPQIREPERYVLARFRLDDPSIGMRPGMLSNIVLATTHKMKALVLPVDAVIQDSKGATVWIRNPDGTFENKMVSTGIQNSQQVEIVDGLDEGDVVVVTGAYLLNSEYVFKRGANHMEGHHGMPGM